MQLQDTPRASSCVYKHHRHGHPQGFSSSILMEAELGTQAGVGFAVRKSEGDVVMTGVQQGAGFVGLEVEEARACIFVVQESSCRGHYKSRD